MKAGLAVIKVFGGRTQSDQVPDPVPPRHRAQPRLEDHPGEQLLIPVPRVPGVVPEAQGRPVPINHAFGCWLWGFGTLAFATFVPNTQVLRNNAGTAMWPNKLSPNLDSSNS